MIRNIISLKCHTFSETQKLISVLQNWLQTWLLVWIVILDQFKHFNCSGPCGQRIRCILWPKSWMDWEDCGGPRLLGWGDWRVSLRCFPIFLSVSSKTVAIRKGVVLVIDAHKQQIQCWWTNFWPGHLNRSVGRRYTATLRLPLTYKEIGWNYLFKECASQKSIKDCAHNLQVLHNQ